jgi:hypothetical protein
VNLIGWRRVRHDHSGEQETTFDGQRVVGAHDPLEDRIVCETQGNRQRYRFELITAESTDFVKARLLARQQIFG